MPADTSRPVGGFMWLWWVGCSAISTGLGTADTADTGMTSTAPVASPIAPIAEPAVGGFGDGVFALAGSSVWPGALAAASDGGLFVLYASCLEDADCDSLPWSLARLGPDGAPDAAFPTVPTSRYQRTALAADSAGGAFLAGGEDFVDPASAVAFGPTGAATAFAAALGEVEVVAVAPVADGGLLVLLGGPAAVVRRLLPDGTPDLAFGVGGDTALGVSGGAGALSPADDGGVVGVARGTWFRLGPDGAVVAQAAVPVGAVALGPDGAGAGLGWDGAETEVVAFDGAGAVRWRAAAPGAVAVDVDAAGRVVAAGSDAGVRTLQGFASDGAPDTAFGPAGRAQDGLGGWTWVEATTHGFVAAGVEGDVLRLRSTAR